ncbi:L,D-transpeptidase family protein [Oryzifoliimicrobium ureilyticus]|uniref:L,D-transpeptidase family protein n=1 Tax=Oryzifoliimicrobium ureilyticus TaxID=3113724 RepID=UPI0030763A0C
MNRLLKTGFMAAAAIVTWATFASVSDAQQVYGQQRSPTVFVTPDGRMLDYIPPNADLVYARDQRGNRVLVDRYGNVVATEMHDRNYYPQRPRRNAGYGDDPYNAEDGYGDNRYGDTRYREPGEVTGGIPQDAPIESAPLDQAYPQSDDQYPARRNGDFASIDPNAGTPSSERGLKQPTEPVITLKNKSKMEIVALQVFLDREGASPGAIDGHMGANVTKAIGAYQQISGQTLDPNNSEDILTRLGMSGGLPIINYTITPSDAAGPYVAEIPEDYSQKASMTSLGYTSVTEMLAERFHMDEGFLKEINPGVDFTVPGTIVKVVNLGQRRSGDVARILADKGKKQIFAYDNGGNLVAAYPASIGSADTPSPSGTVTVERVAFNPGYTYNPKINFKQGANDKVLNIPPGPNGPVGTVWIALSKPTYGIHGTPEPSKIGKTQSHGCVRLTNWDATALAKMVKPGTVVEFID